jgi:hypothetical protein
VDKTALCGIANRSGVHSDANVEALLLAIRQGGIEVDIAAINVLETDFAINEPVGQA